MSDDLKQRLVRTEVLFPPGEPFTLEAVKPWLKANMAIRKAAADRIEELEAKLAKAAEALVQLVVEYDEVDLAYDEPTSMTAAVNVAMLITAELKGNTDAPE